MLNFIQPGGLVIIDIHIDNPRHQKSSDYIYHDT